jgi:thiamine-phosphate pyrophosphorylase
VTSNDLRRALRLIVITDRYLAAPRSVEHVVATAIEAGARTIQLRDKRASPQELMQQARRLLKLTRPAGALLLVNDRVDVALAVKADGVHIGPDDLPVRTVCQAVPDGFLVGYSTDDPDAAEKAEGAGVDYIGCGSVFRTDTKNVGDEAIGLDGLDAVARAVSIPVVAIGGVSPSNAKQIATTAAAGTAVVRGVMAAEDPGAAVRDLLAALSAH